jgi:hypothetical protein
MNRRDPRIRQTIDRLTSTLETANLNTQASIWSFTESYISPCLNSISQCLEFACYPCFGAYRDRLRAARNRNRLATARGRPELVFDFYNDEWDDLEEDENTGLLGGWGNEGLDRLLAGSVEPGRRAGMSYGSRGRRQSVGKYKGADADPTIVPNSSMFGFLERFPWRIGKKGVRYKPSAADLQDNPGRRRMVEEEDEPLLEESEADENGEGRPKMGKRKRSGTANSRSTNTSLSSRGDLIPSEDEADAVALDDEFAMELGRRNTNQETASEGAGSGKARKRPDGLRAASTRTTRTASSKSTRSARTKRRRPPAAEGDIQGIDEDAQEITLPTLEDLKREEQLARDEDEAEVVRKRQEAHAIAVERGLSSPQMREAGTGISSGFTSPGSKADYSSERESTASYFPAVPPSDGVPSPQSPAAPAPESPVSPAEKLNREDG